MTDLHDPFQFLLLSTLVFSIGIMGVSLNGRNFINMLVSIEIILLSAIMNFVFFSKLSGTITGSVFAIFVLGIGAAESAIGLAIMIAYYRNNKTIDINRMNSIKE